MKCSRGFTLFSLTTGLLVFSALFVPVSVSQNPTYEVFGTPAGWSDEINLSKTMENHEEPSIAVFQDEVHVVWRNGTGPTNIKYAKSINGGESWSPIITLDSSTDLEHYPEIAISQSNLHVVWADRLGWNGIYYRNSTDGGESWNSEKRISPDGLDSYTPHIYANNSNVHIIWGDTRDGGDGEIYYRRSLDGGITFDNGQGVDEDRRITYSPATISWIYMDGYGSNISVIWADERDGDWEIYWMISKDNGFTWEDGLGTPNVGRKISDSVDDANKQSIAVDGSNIHIIWSEQQWPGPVYRLFYRNSTDNGVTWNTPRLLTGPVSSINNPDIDVSGDEVHVVWGDERDDGEHEEIYYKNSTDGGISWSTDLRLTFNQTEWSYWPRIAIQNETKHIVWFNWFGSANRDVFYKRYPDFPPDPIYNITLNEGWNLVSLPLEQSDESIDQVLSSINGKWDYIQTYDAINGIWQSNATFKPNQLNDFNTLNHKIGFWINITEPGGVNLTVQGYEPVSTIILLKAGWNLVGYPTLNNSMTVANALFGTTADRVEICDTSEPYNIREVGPTYVMKPGEGYWVHVQADSTWIVNW